MNFQVYAVLAVYAVTVIRSFSFGVYGLRNKNSALFAVILLEIAVSGILLFEYLRATI